ncbi:hypothetical protein M3I54_39205 [Paraburkholderia sp. CNPSo 3274]|uniref:DUF7713 domain-containing protein n=1 Tax=Paraburkholderia sp. CNPSo 3274 TaxID=2940932 RepID=UPI0020B75CD7|nr:hypothetical protein [Paraburkholderia sp. CNPSo 3274]MCP3712859.1 hypothetical protein [Paraburkholderia sp. CNPSo 3274]
MAIELKLGSIHSPGSSVLSIAIGCKPQVRYRRQSRCLDFLENRVDHLRYDENSTRAKAPPKATTDASSVTRGYDALRLTAQWLFLPIPRNLKIRRNALLDKALRGLIEWDEAQDGHLPLVVVDGKEVSWNATLGEC